MVHVTVLVGVSEERIEPQVMGRGDVVQGLRWRAIRLRGYLGIGHDGSGRR